jgi:DNA-binding NarL/FixJ family response regulator
MPASSAPVAAMATRARVLIGPGPGAVKRGSEVGGSALPLAPVGLGGLEGLSANEQNLRLWPQDVHRRDTPFTGSARAYGRYGRPVTRVIVADDSFIVREGLRELLDAGSGIQVVGACGDLDALLTGVETERPDVVITDIRMPPSNTDEGIQAAAMLRKSHPRLGVVVLSQYSDPGFVLALLESGSDGRAYLLKERVHDLTQLTSAVEAVAAGGSVIDPKIVEVLVAARARGESSPLAELTERERDVLGEVAQGKSNVAIAESLRLSKRAVEKHTHSIFMKLGLANAEEVSRRVKATLLFLADAEETPTPSGA